MSEMPAMSGATAAPIAPMHTTLAQLFALAGQLAPPLAPGHADPAGNEGRTAGESGAMTAVPTPAMAHAQIAAWQLHGDAPVNGIATDSRNVQAGDLFIALRGENFDAHDFLDQVQTTASALILSRVPENCRLPYILVPDTRLALGQLGRAWRAQFDSNSLPLIGVTGSNGKTTVKEMIAAILATQFGTEQRLATRGNLNNDIGVPLTLLTMRATQRAGVVELGMNHPGEIAYLASLAAPQVALINNAQREHLEFMQDVATVAKENGSVLASLGAAGTAVFPADEEHTALWRSLARASGCKVLTFGLGAGPDGNTADVSCDYRVTEFGNQLRVALRNGSSVRMFPLKLAVAGVHNVRNALAAIACTVALGIDILVIARALEAFEPVGGRLQRKIAFNGAILIDDTYNANPDSVRAAIAVLAQSASPRILVLGDMGEVGTQGPEFHQEVGQFALQQGIDQVFCLGALTTHTQAAFGPGAQHFAQLADLLQALTNSLSQQSTVATVLVKGSRFMKMERVVQHLVQTGGSPAMASQLQGIH